ncbi:hypothetical protein B0H14DRAFT_3151674 [Mycena olivaceomarginata]|nr:hypothetical protein B0H14DRAFT_3151674 [Mycena olivaceomarginata]
MIIILETDSTYNEMKKVVTLQLCLLNQFEPAFSTIGLTFILWNASHTHQGFTEIRIRFFALLRRTLRVSAPYEPSNSNFWLVQTAHIRGITFFARSARERYYALLQCPTSTASPPDTSQKRF